jgi:hypothetical protein
VDLIGREACGVLTPFRAKARSLFAVKFHDLKVVAIHAIVLQLFEVSFITLEQH